MLSVDEQAYVARLYHLCPPIALARALVREFLTVIRDRDVPGLSAWLNGVAVSGISELISVANGLCAPDRAARWGWSNRKDARIQAVKRFNHLLRTADRRVLRLYTCDLAETTLPLWEARYPGDMRLLALLQVARRYVLGEANNEERLAASRLAVMVCRASEAPRSAGRHDPAYAAANAVGCCLWRLTGESLRHASYWTAEAHRTDNGYTPEGAHAMLAELETRLATAQ